MVWLLQVQLWGSSFLGPQVASADQGSMYLLILILRPVVGSMKSTAKPKSQTSNWWFSPIRRLSSFRSLWAMPFLWISSMAKNSGIPYFEPSIQNRPELLVLAAAPAERSLAMYPDSHSPSWCIRGLEYRACVSLLGHQQAAEEFGFRFHRLLAAELWKLWEPKVDQQNWLIEHLSIEDGFYAAE